MMHCPLLSFVYLTSRLAHIYEVIYLRKCFVIQDCKMPRYVGPCHHDMARPHVADEGDGLQIWTVAANLLVLTPC
jgi:hypothetical protein